MAATTATTAASERPARAPRGSLLGHWNSAVTSYYLVVGCTALLVLLGLVMVLSSSSVTSLAAGDSPYAVFLDQARYALVGLPLAWVASRMPVPLLRRLAWPAVLVAISLQLLVFVPGLGREVYGNRNWIVVGGQSIQPSELAKLALALWLGVVLARKRPLLGNWLHAFIPVVPVVGVVVALVLGGHDLGTAMILLLVVAGGMWVAGTPLRMLATAALAGALVVWPLVALNGNRVGRIGSWLGADCDVTAGCYQTQHGIYGLASGGWFGLGLGASREKWSYLPMAHNDFIFAIIGEELGLFGTLLVLGLFVLLALAMTRIVHRHPDPFVKIATAGIGCWVLGQALINIGVVIGLLPVIGVPLPLVSAGGSALITTMVALGVVVAFARSEPGAAEALAARPSVLRRSLAVLAPARRVHRG